MMPANPLNTIVEITQEQFDRADCLMLQIDQTHERVYLAGTLAEKRRMIAARSRLIKERQALLALNGEQYEAIKRFAKEYGHQWKAHLRQLWSGRLLSIKAADAALLQQVRNQCGPQWLEQFRLIPQSVGASAPIATGTLRMHRPR